MTRSDRLPRSPRPRRRTKAAVRPRWGPLMGGAALLLFAIGWYRYGAVVLWLAGLALAAYAVATVARSSAPGVGRRPPGRRTPPQSPAEPLSPVSRAASVDMNTLTVPGPAGRLAESRPAPTPERPQPKPVKLPRIPPPLYPHARSLLAGREPAPPEPEPQPEPMMEGPDPVELPSAEQPTPELQTVAEAAPARTALTLIPGGKRPPLLPDTASPASSAAAVPVLPPKSAVGAYQIPTTAMLPVPAAVTAMSDDEHIERAILLEQTLKTFGVEARVVDISPGPAVTRYELQPAPGVRVNKFTQLADDLALALAAEGIRIEAPIPGKSAVGIEVPNKERQMVPLREVLERPQFMNSPSKLAVAFGKDNAGNPVVGDLARMPHLLIAGSTGSGKSVCMNTIICSLLFKARPDEVKMLMIDPKMVELSIYNGIPHLTAPVIIDARKAAGFLKGAIKEMENRYTLFAALGVRNIQQYNQLVAADPGPDPEHPRQPLPYVVIFIDELADLMMVAPADVEDAICRLAQMARACGMHLVIATQSPRVDVITGLIKANVPSRIAFAVSSQIDSRVIMDTAGAERLLGRGDMLYHPSGLSKPVRAQGAFIDEGSVEELVRFVKQQGRPTFTAQEVTVDPEAKKGAKAGAPEEAAAPSAADTAFPLAVRMVIEHGQASVSILQRRLRCNYNKAVRLIDMMEERGFVGPHQGSRPRDVLISLPQWREEFSSSEAGEVVEPE